MALTNFEKYVYSKMCLKQRRQPPSLQQSRRYLSRRKSHLATAFILGRPVLIPNKVFDWLEKQ